MWEVFIFINTLINLELETSKKGIFVLLVTVPVSRAPLAFGRLTSSIFPGTCVLTVANPLGSPRKDIILRSLLPVLLTLVILLNIILAPVLTRKWVPEWLKPTVPLVFVVDCCSRSSKLRTKTRVSREPAVN